MWKTPTVAVSLSRSEEQEWEDAQSVTKVTRRNLSSVMMPFHREVFDHEHVDIRARASRLSFGRANFGSRPGSQHDIGDNWTRRRKAAFANGTLSAAFDVNFRFFRSQHVADLRLLVSLATIVFCAYFLILAAVTIVNPTIHLFEYFLRFAGVLTSLFSIFDS